MTSIKTGPNKDSIALTHWANYLYCCESFLSPSDFATFEQSIILTLNAYPNLLFTYDATKKKLPNEIYTGIIDCFYRLSVDSVYKSIFKTIDFAYFFVDLGTYPEILEELNKEEFKLKRTKNLPIIDLSKQCRYYELIILKNRTPIQKEEPKEEQENNLQSLLTVLAIGALIAGIIKATTTSATIPKNKKTNKKAIVESKEETEEETAKKEKSI